MITLTSISTGITSLVFFLIGLRVFFSWRKTRLPEMKFFSIFLISFGFQQLFFSLGTGPASGNPTLSNLLWLIAHIFMFIGISYFIRFPIRTKFPNLETVIFRVTILYSIIGMLVLFYSLPEVEPFLLEGGVYNWKVPAKAGATIGIFTITCLLLAFAIFIDGFRKARQKATKMRSLFLALGILVFLIAGPLHNFVTTPLSNLLADAALIVGPLLMFLGLYLSKVFVPKQKL